MMSNHEHSSHTHRRRKGLGKIAVATLPAVLLAGLLTITGPAGAQEGSNGILMGEGEPSGDSDGPRDIAPGESLSTVRGTAGNPVNRDDPFALELQNVSDDTLFAFIEEQVCDGNQPEPLCSQPRLGGKAGYFRFSPSGGGSVAAHVLGLPAEPVVIARLFYNRNLVRRADGIKIFFEKIFGGAVVRLPNCDDDGDGPTTECYSARKLGSGDQVVRVPLQFDPRITRG